MSQLKQAERLRYVEEMNPFFHVFVPFRPSKDLTVPSVREGHLLYSVYKLNANLTQKYFHRHTPNNSKCLGTSCPSQVDRTGMNHQDAISDQVLQRLPLTWSCSRALEYELCSEVFQPEVRELNCHISSPVNHCVSPTVSSKVSPEALLVFCACGWTSPEAEGQAALLRKAAKELSMLATGGKTTQMVEQRMEHCYCPRQWNQGSGYIARVSTF